MCVYALENCNRVRIYNSLKEGAKSKFQIFFPKLLSWSYENDFFFFYEYYVILWKF